MFVKKDLRKIPVILKDAMFPEDEENKPKPLIELRLARRPTEFPNGSIQNILCQPMYIPALQNLISISLYDCQIRNLNGIGFFASSKRKSMMSGGDHDEDIQMENMDPNDANNDNDNDCICPNLTELNLGRNPISEIPPEMAQLKSLKSLWLDDCEIKGSLPTSLYELRNLNVLRLSHNQITSVDEHGVKQWKEMEVLCLDGNGIESIPTSFVELNKLKSLMLRYVCLCMKKQNILGLK